MILSREKHRVLISWLFSYASVLVIPIIVSVFVYVEAARVVELGVSQTSQIRLRQLRQVVDNQLLDIENLGKQIALHPRLISLMHVHPPFRDNHHYSISQIVRDFRLFEVTRGYIGQFYVALHNSDIVLTSTAVLDDHLFFELNHAIDGFSLEQWLEMTRAVNVRHYTTMARRVAQQVSNRAIALFQSIPLEDPRNPLGTIVILLDEQRLNSIISTVGPADMGTVYIIDPENNLVLTTGAYASLPRGLRYQDMQSPDGQFELVYENEQHIVSYASSSVTDWKYVMSTPKTVFMQMVNRIHRLTLASLILCVLIGGTVSILFTQKNYQSIRRILKTIATKVGSPIRDSPNEYAFINNAIEAVITQNQLMSERIDQQTLVLQDSVLRRLILGQLTTSIPVHDALASCNIALESRQFALLVLSIEHSADRASGGDASMEDERTLKLRTIRSVVASAVEPTANGYVTDVNGLFACLLSLTIAEPGDVWQQLRGIPTRVKEALFERLSIGSTIAVSDTHATPDEIALAYQEALQGLEYKMIIGGGRIIFYDVPGQPVFPVMVRTCR